MNKPRILSTAAGRRTATVVAGISVFMTAGVVAAAGGTSSLGLHSDTAVSVDAPITEPPTTLPSAVVAATVDAAAAAAAATPTIAPEPATTQATAQDTTQAAIAETATGSVGVEPAAPPTTKPDTVVPHGITLACRVVGNSVECHWTGAVVDLLGEVLLLRSDGRVVFANGDASASSYTDVNVAAGSYSYVLVTTDIAGVTLVHSNRAAVEIAG